MKCIWKYKKSAKLCSSQIIFPPEGDFGWPNSVPGGYYGVFIFQETTSHVKMRSRNALHHDEDSPSIWISPPTPILKWVQWLLAITMSSKLWTAAICIWESQRLFLNVCKMVLFCCPMRLHCLGHRFIQFDSINPEPHYLPLWLCDIVQPKMVFAVN